MHKGALPFLVIGALTTGIAVFTSQVRVEAEPVFSRWVDEEGNIALPTGYRAHWAHLGSWFVRDRNGEVSFHEVYTEPQSLAYFHEERQFPDGATIVKEIRGTRSATMTTGEAMWADRLQVWFVMIKDTEERFENHPLWGDGWGWALFEAENPHATVTGNYSQECIPCHVPAMENDWVYVEGYPTLGLASPEVSTPAARTGPMVNDGGEADGPVVRIENLAFLPSVIRVGVGETITWVNLDASVHTATANDDSFDTEKIAPGEKAQVAFEEAGTFAYYCTPHPFMKATVIVEE